MRDTIITSFILISVFTSCATLYPSYPVIVDYSIDPIVEVIDSLDSVENLYVKANEWMVNTFNDAESTIQFSDKEQGAVIGKFLLEGELYNIPSQYYGYGVSTPATSIDTRVFAIIDVRVKENRARISIAPQSWKSYSETITPLLIKTKAELLIEDFKKHMKTRGVDF